MTMIERVEEAISLACDDASDGENEYCSPAMAKAAARAVIEAMRQITPEMLQAGQGWDGIPAIWNRMIDAALAEK